MDVWTSKFRTSAKRVSFNKNVTFKTTVPVVWIWTSRMQPFYVQLKGANVVIIYSNVIFTAKKFL